MAKLTDVQKLFITKALACFDTPTQVAAAAKEEFGIDVPRTQVSKYDPSKEAGRDLSAKLRVVFEATRKAFVEVLSEVPIANQAYRLRTLQRHLILADSRGNTAMVAQLLEQAAKEVGGALTNRRELTGKGGGPIEQRAETVQMTPEEFRTIAKKLLDEV